LNTKYENIVEQVRPLNFSVKTSGFSSKCSLALASDNCFKVRRPLKLFPHY